ncbi:hypothetical protein [Massilia sp. ZL223]|uniref:hypothetical protein n=1 Tax=Massilia sp. ZL223 TaxID=2824904 RepID=UPI001B828134|nr:hypothetical protein [Massilia sp. ZL223]MBQ5965076.1 hypothetical protein [Massilia sp. ZL223]
MNIHKHMEAIFVVTLGVLGAGKFALDSLPEAKAKPSAPVARNIATAGTMAVVIVRAPRLPRHP